MLKGAWRFFACACVIISTTLSSIADDVTVLNASDRSACEFYKDLSATMSCTKNDYLLDFAYRYCVKFQLTNHQYSEHGQQVLARIRACLIEEMNLAHQSNNGFQLTCQNASDIGFASHVGCYVDSGFCSMPKSEHLQIAATVITQVFNPKLRAVRREIYRRCEL